MQPLERVMQLWQGDVASQRMGMEIIHVDEAHVAVQMRVQENMLNGHQICHGGYIFSLADSCFAFASNSGGDKMVAQHCDINFFQPVGKDEILTAKSDEVHRRGRSAIYDVWVRNEKGELVGAFRGLARQIDAGNIKKAGNPKGAGK